jgi:hypothetical protein
LAAFFGLVLGSPWNPEGVKAACLGILGEETATRKDGSSLFFCRRRMLDEKQMRVFHTWWYPNSWMVFNFTMENPDGKWMILGYPPFPNPYME